MHRFARSSDHPGQRRQIAATWRLPAVVRLAGLRARGRALPGTTVTSARRVPALVIGRITSRRPSRAATVRDATSRGARSALLSQPSERVGQDPRQQSGTWDDDQAELLQERERVQLEPVLHDSAVLIVTVKLESLERHLLFSGGSPWNAPVCVPSKWILCATKAPSPNGRTRRWACARQQTGAGRR